MLTIDAEMRAFADANTPEDFTNLAMVGEMIDVLAPLGAWAIS
jgi:hypothetical protein